MALVEVAVILPLLSSSKLLAETRTPKAVLPDAETSAPYSRVRNEGTVGDVVEMPKAVDIAVTFIRLLAEGLSYFCSRDRRFFVQGRNHRFLPQH